MIEDPDPSDRPTIQHRNRATGIEVAVAIKSPKWRSRMLDAEALCHQAVGGVLAVVDPPDVLMEVSVVLADDELLQRLNRKSRGVDRPTNVLAFPCDSPGESVPVGKAAAAVLPAATALAERANMLHAGTTLLSGRATGLGAI